MRRNLARYGMWLSDFISPISSSNRDNWKFCYNDSTANSCCYFFWAFYTKSNVAIVITDSNECLNKNFVPKIFLKHIVIDE